MLIYLSLLDSREDKNKFTQLYNTYRYTMLYTADNILQDKGLAEDAVHDAFLRIAKNLHKTGAVDSPRTKAFVVIIVRNIALTMAKRHGRNLLFEDENMIKVDVMDNVPERKIVVATKEEIDRTENVNEFLEVLKVHELV